MDYATLVADENIAPPSENLRWIQNEPVKKLNAQRISLAAPKIVVNPGLVVQIFRYRPDNPTAVNCVFLAGDFDGWMQHAMEKTDNGFFTIAFGLAPGSYKYKYNVGGRWEVCREDAESFHREIMTDSEGNRYHKLIVRTLPETVRANAKKPQDVATNQTPASSHSATTTLPASASMSDESKRLSIFKRASNLFRSSLKAPSNNTEKEAGRMSFSLRKSMTKGGDGKSVGQAKVDNIQTINIGAPMEEQASKEEELVNIEKMKEYISVLHNLNDYQHAVALHETIITSRKKLGMQNTVQYAVELKDYASVLSKLGRLEDAEKALRDSIAAWKLAESNPTEVQALANEKEKLADTHHYLAVILDKQKKREQARPSFDSALKIYLLHGAEKDNVFGENAKLAYKNYARNLNKQKVPKEQILAALEPYSAIGKDVGEVLKE